MTPERFKFLQANFNERLTPEELAEGYFFCCTWDYLLVQQGDAEATCCTCLKDYAMPPPMTTLKPGGRG